MKNFSTWRMGLGCLIILMVGTGIGCSNSDSGVVAPNTPPLSAEAGMEKAKKQQQDRIIEWQNRAKRKAKQ